MRNMAGHLEVNLFAFLEIFDSPAWYNISDFEAHFKGWILIDEIWGCICTTKIHLFRRQRFGSQRTVPGHPSQSYST
jgi:threonine dehydrogenase-like Zn-dependent dehydrogenase